MHAKKPLAKLIQEAISAARPLAAPRSTNEAGARATGTVLPTNSCGGPMRRCRHRICV